MDRFNNYVSQWKQHGFPVEIVDAPKWVVSFDKIIVVRSGPNLRSIKLVAIYDSKQDRIIKEF